MGKSLRELRLEKGMTLQELADATGIGKSTLGNYETGRTTMTAAKISAVAACLKTPVSQLCETPVLSRNTASMRAASAAATSGGSTPCRYPTDCDLVRELSDMKGALAILTGQVNTLTQLLGASLHKFSEAPERDHRTKAG